MQFILEPMYKIYSQVVIVAALVVAVVVVVVVVARKCVYFVWRINSVHVVERRFLWICCPWC